MSEQLSKDDQNRVNNCEYYLRTKQVMKNAEAYKELSVGEVYYIKHKGYDDKEEYVCAGWNDEPAKYMVFHKEEGFVFVKRIIANGKMGKEVTCLTTTFNIDEYWLEADPDYVNSILLENEEGYDPLAASKKVASNKNKARRRNKKLEINYGTPQEAHAFTDSLKVGDLLYDSDTTYGSGMLTWEVTSVLKRTVNQDVSSDRYYNRNEAGSTSEDRIHNRHGIINLVAVEVKIKTKDVPKSRRYTSKDQTLTFADFYTSSYRKYYKTKPYTVDDV